MMVLDVERAVGVPEHVSAEQAALTEPLAVRDQGGRHG